MIVLHTKPVPINQKFFICRGRNILSSKYRDAKLALSYEVMANWKKPMLTDSVEIILDQYFGDKRKRDIDAYLKMLLDSMSGIVYEDDSQIVKLTVQKLYDKENPRTEITCKKYDQGRNKNIKRNSSD